VDGVRELLWHGAKGREEEEEEGGSWLARLSRDADADCSTPHVPPFLSQKCLDTTPTWVAVRTLVWLASEHCR